MTVWLDPKDPIVKALPEGPARNACIGQITGRATSGLQVLAWTAYYRDSPERRAATRAAFERLWEIQEWGAQNDKPSN